MGNKKNKQIVTIIVMLAFVSVLVYWPFPDTDRNKSRSLHEALIQPGNYLVANQSVLSEVTVNTLELDDYVQNRYIKPGESEVELYIGYYFSLAKLSSAHSPLVCFPGQGWELSETRTNMIEAGGHPVHYMEMTAGLEDHKMLVMYWFQAGEKTAVKIYRNKINALINKLTGNSEDHAFVRVSVPLTHDDIEDARAAGRDFIQSFYPAFFKYVNGS